MVDLTGTGWQGAQHPPGEVPRPGGRVGRFEIAGVLGTGGMGVVLEAKDPDLQRRVALKLLKPEVVSGDPLDDGLLTEARAAARLAHPNVVTVYEAGFHAGQPFVVMECVDGPNLATWARSEQRSWREALRLLIGTARGLEAAHRAGLIHRDIKPQNILVHEERARITDFGIARTIEQLGAVVWLQEKESSGQPGTPAYMAPEQRRGEALDPRTDQYAFAVTALRTFKLTTLPPRRVRAVLERARSERPEDRFPTMAELIEALDRVEVGPRVGGAVTAALAACLLGFVAYPWLRPACPDPTDQFALSEIASLDERAARKPFAASAWSRTRTALADYRERWAEQWASSCRATRVEGVQSAEAFERRRACLDRHRRVVEASVGALASVDEPGEIAVRAIALAERLPWLSDCEDPSSVFAVEPIADPRTRERLLSLERSMAEIEGLLDAARFREAAEALPALESEAGAIGYRPALARAQVLAGRVYGMNGATTRAEARLRSAAATATEIGMDRLAATAWIELIGALDDEGRSREALGLEAPTVAFMARAGLGPRWRLRLADEVGHALYRLGRFEEGVAKVRAALEHAAPLLEEEEGFAEYARAYNILGVLFTRMGRVDEALAALERAKTLRSARGPGVDPFLATILSNEAAAYKYRRDYEASIARHRAALEIVQSIYPPEHPEIAVHLGNLGQVLLDAGRIEEAGETLRRSIALREAAHGRDDPGLVNSLNKLALLYWEPGKYDRARAIHRRALEIAERAFGNESLAVGSTLEFLAGTYLEEGRFSDAIPLFRRSLRLGEASHPNAPEKLHYRMYGLGLALLEVGEVAEGSALIDRAATIERGPTDAIARQEQRAASALADHLRHRSAGRKLAEALDACPLEALRCQMLHRNARRWEKQFGLHPRRESSGRGLTRRDEPTQAP